MIGPSAMARPFVAPPGMPADKAALLRRAFDATMQDPNFLRDVAASRTELGPIPGETLERTVEHILATPKAWVERARGILQ